MLSPASLEAMADQLVRDRLNQAAHAALLQQLPRPAPRHRTPLARQFLASALRELAWRLDPSSARETPLAGANAR